MALTVNVDRLLATAGDDKAKKEATRRDGVSNNPAGPSGAGVGDSNDTMQKATNIPPAEQQGNGGGRYIYHKGQKLRVPDPVVDKGASQGNNIQGVTGMTERREPQHPPPVDAAATGGRERRKSPEWPGRKGLILIPPSRRPLESDVHFFADAIFVTTCDLDGDEEAGQKAQERLNCDPDWARFGPLRDKTLRPDTARATTTSSAAETSTAGQKEAEKGGQTAAPIEILADSDGDVEMVG